jgi:DNA-3-methyladenine glycosylase
MLNRTAATPLLVDYCHDPVTMARRLIGQRLVRVIDGNRLAGTIVEVEAYLGGEDRAAHSFGGRRTGRNESMYLPGGHAYVYMIYGIHHCLNVVCGERDEGVAVLIRAIQPTEGLDFMQRRRRVAREVTHLCSGPGKLAEALAIDRTIDGHDLRLGNELFIEELLPKPIGLQKILTRPRIGVAYAGEWASKPLRFLLAGSRYVSRP